MYADCNASGVSSVDFDHDSSGNLTKQGMLELVEWFEDDLIDRRVNESKEIEGFEELK